jgi:hypothetical protein
MQQNPRMRVPAAGGALAIPAAAPAMNPQLSAISHQPPGPERFSLIASFR